MSRQNALCRRRQDKNDKTLSPRRGVVHAWFLAVRTRTHSERNSEREGPYVHTPGCPASG
jgi:hypothetical protein